jgi:hypothetical protein
MKSGTGGTQSNGSPREGIDDSVATMWQCSSERGSTTMAPRAALSLDGAPTPLYEEVGAVRQAGTGVQQWLKQRTVAARLTARKMVTDRGHMDNRPHSL